MKKKKTMGETMSSLWFRLVLTLFCAWMFYYVIWRFFVIFHNNLKTVPLIIALALACCIILTFMYQWNSKILGVLSTISSRIFVLWFLLMIMLLIENVISIWYKTNPRIIIWVIVAILGLWAYFALHTKITNLYIQSDKIPRDIKILLVSDIHAENVIQTFHINKIKKAVKNEKPDFVVIAWDLINRANTGYIQYFSDLNFNDNPPILAVIGNHDVMWNTEIVKNIPNESGIKFLNNDSLKIDWIQLIWIIDKSLRWNQTLEEILNLTKMDKNSDLFSILVTHQPISLEKLRNYPIDLEVAWHTHRGQFFWMRKVVEWMNDYVYWEYRLWNKIAFVTQWIWTWWLPFRLWTQSEMVIINLIKK